MKENNSIKLIITKKKMKHEKILLLASIVLHISYDQFASVKNVLRDYDV